jgi:ribosomal protein S27AE
MRKKCPNCGAKMILADNSEHVSSMSFLNSEILLLISVVVLLVFNDSVLGWIIGGLVSFCIFIWIVTTNRYRDFECSKCTYME